MDKDHDKLEIERMEKLRKNFPAVTSATPCSRTESTSNFEVIYISYDEPNADENWADLLKKVPWAKRIHGVKGFDEAHKRAARISQTLNFITIDGDNKIDPTFLDQEIVYNPDWVYSWGGKNYVNGLIYGNGGIKLWPKGVVLNMNTHESTEDDEGIEFCWKLPYYQMNDWYSVSYNNATPFQAFRVGFREGVKLSLHNGRKVKNLKTEVWHGNLKRLKIWMSVGADVQNGIYSIYGARLGCYMTNLTDFDISLISDYDWFNEQWHSKWMTTIEDEELFRADYNRLLGEIQNVLELEIANLGKTQSIFVKSTLENPLRLGLTVPEKGNGIQLMNDNFKEKNI